MFSDTSVNQSIIPQVFPTQALNPSLKSIKKNVSIIGISIIAIIVKAKNIIKIPEKVFKNNKKKLAIVAKIVKIKIPTKCLPNLFFFVLIFTSLDFDSKPIFSLLFSITKWNRCAFTILSICNIINSDY